MRTRLIAASLLAVAACGEEQGAGGVTADESRQLNEAAAMLDEAPDAIAVDEEATAETGQMVVPGEDKEAE
jgi:hypothetical protein